MQTNIYRRLSRHTCWVAAVAAILWPALDAGAQDLKKKFIVRHPAAADAPVVRVLKFTAEDGPAGPLMGLGEGHGRRAVMLRTVAADKDAADRKTDKPTQEPGTSRWWLGVECTPIERTLAKHLGLKEGQGLIVMHVVEGSAAHEAGLKPDDVLVRAGDRELGTLIDLVEVVNASEGKTLKLELIREGEKTTLEVTPKERPRDHRLGPMVREYGGPFRFRVLGPGVIEPFAIKVHRERPKLPKDVTVTITATGEEPIRVKVQRGDKSWDVTADQLDELPEDLRPAVAALLPQRDVFRPAAGVHMAVPGAAYPTVPEPLPGWPAFEFPHQEELQKQIDELRKRVEELQKQFTN